MLGLLSHLPILVSMKMFRVLATVGVVGTLYGFPLFLVAKFLERRFPFGMVHLLDEILHELPEIIVMPPF
jgi:hypothetical protein